jgi:cytochrome c553
MNESPLFSWRNQIFRRSVIALAISTLAFMLIGFVWLPSMHEDFTVKGLWASLCRAAGVPADWQTSADAEVKAISTRVVLTPSMANRGENDAVGRGATLALNCSMCHGTQGMSISNSPNLAGQYPEVVIKQMQDYRTGHRSSAIMEAIASALSDQDIRDLAAYYAYLPKARTAPTTYDEKLPALVRVGDPLRNIAPCISCHGQVDQKLGAPWLEGMPKQYLVDQINAFVSGVRRNDPGAQMRNMVRAMTPEEIDEVASFYARKASAGEREQAAAILQ